MARPKERRSRRRTADIETFRGKLLSGVKGAHHIYVILLGLEPGVFSNAGRVVGH